MMNQLFSCSNFSEKGPAIMSYLCLRSYSSSIVPSFLRNWNQGIDIFALHYCGFFDCALVSATRILKKLGIVDRQVEFGDKNEIDLLYQIGKADLRFGTGPPLASLGCKKTVTYVHFQPPSLPAIFGYRNGCLVEIVYLDTLWLCRSMVMP